MRIGIFSESYAPVINGVAVSVATFTEQFREMGHEVFIFATGHPDQCDEDEFIIRFPSFRTRIEPDYPIAIPYLPGIGKRVAELKLDVIHTQTPWMLGWLGMKLANNLGIPIVSTNHTEYTQYAHYFPLAPDKTKKAFVVGVMRNYYNRCDCVVVPSEPVERQLREYGVTTRTRVIPTGITVCADIHGEARGEVRAKYGFKDEEIVLLYVGRVAKEKNLNLLITAFGKLAAKRANLRLMIVGGGVYLEEIRTVVESSPAVEKIVITGSVPRAKIGRYYAAGDLFTFPSGSETQGLVVGEALQAGLPCVVVNEGSCAEAVTDGEDGFVAENNADDFARKISALTDNPTLLQEFSARAAKNGQRFSPRAAAERMLEVYRSVQRPQP
ncbi:MAG: glycosyltransferase family 4 protein [Armatimonadota bacterium]